MKIRTKDELIELGITVDGMNVYRDGKLLNPHIFYANHKYGKRKEYWYYTFNKTAYSRANIMYCWYIGDRDVTKDIDHINNDSLDDRPENLQLLTRQENLRKRPSNGRNQWYYIRRNKNEEH